MFCAPRYAVNRTAALINRWTEHTLYAHTHIGGNWIEANSSEYRNQSKALIHHGATITLSERVTFEYMVIIRVNELAVSIWRFYGSRFCFISCQFRSLVLDVPIPILVAMWFQLHYSLCYLHNVLATIQPLINWMTVLMRRKRNGWMTI